MRKFCQLCEEACDFDFLPLCKFCRGNKKILEGLKFFKDIAEKRFNDFKKLWEIQYSLGDKLNHREIVDQMEKINAVDERYQVALRQFENGKPIQV